MHLNCEWRFLSANLKKNFSKVVCEKFDINIISVVAQLFDSDSDGYLSEEDIHSLYARLNLVGAFSIRRNPSIILFIPCNFSSYWL